MVVLKNTFYVENKLDRGISGLNVLWLLMYLMGMGVFFVGMPKYYDDYWYMEHLRPWFEAQGVMVPENGGNIFSRGIPWSGIWDTWREHYLTDNIRLPNLIMPFLLLFPKWVGSGLMTLLWGVSVFTSFRLAGIDWRKSCLVVPALFMWTFMMPWGDHFGVMNWQLNYIMPISIALVYVLYVGKEEKTSLRNRVVVVLLGFIVGMSHEGISIPVLAGILGQSLISEGEERKRRLWGAAGVFLGIVLLASVPGTAVRLASRLGQKGLGHLIYQLRTDIMPFLIFVITVMAVYWKHKPECRKLLHDRILIFCAVSAIGSLGVAVVTGYLGRGWIWMDVGCIIGCLKLWREFCRIRVNGKHNISVPVMLVIMLVMMFSHLVLVDYHALKLRTMTTKMLNWYTEESSPTFFSGYRTMNNMPLMCGYLPEARFPNYVGYMYEYYHGTQEMPQGARLPIIFPEELRYVDDTTGRQLDGETDARVTGGYYYAPDKGYVADIWTEGEIDYGNGPEGMTAAVFPFISEKNGKRYVWIIPDVGWIASHTKEVKGINLKQVKSYEE